MNQKEAEFEKRKMQINREELIERMIRLAPENSLLKVFPDIFIYQSSKPTESQVSVFKPAFCVIAQGSKDVLLNDELFHYDSDHYLISTLDLPIMSNVVEASEEKPYLNLRIDLDLAVVAAVMIDSGIETKKSDAGVKAMDVSPVDADLLDAVVKLVKLFDTPDEMKFLAPLIIREIIYRLLKGKQRARLSQLITTEGDVQRISRVVSQIRENIDQPLKIEDTARELGMSVSGFHSHFKSVTAMSPLQFQKQIRLQEARRLMLGENMDVASASFRVGYDDASYFSREYKKLFGIPPHRDIAKLRGNLASLTTSTINSKV
ncbi:AraC family transcriptional regulator [Komarekiella sp. 'clone 1']|uniref:AraC family transcriptional regulator n=1 Tax=Komarekiella delphini-convector SJRDD-AB1 TaxID=2593771 RepID=A0AA40ST40_9NOST|nr:AraC family transcriptional regulator [Komarekiella delphini-convector]MBD6614765.1 AraC family transcriptional regulator [Komarekiella delphini-convector SJRDD-AB1]